MWFNPLDWVNPFDGAYGYVKDLAVNWVLNNFFSSFSELLTQLVGFFGNFINDIFAVIVQINNSWAGDIARYTTSFACLFTIVLALKQYFVIYVLETEGDSDADPLDILLRASEAIAFACSGTAIFDILMNFSIVFVKEFLYSVEPEGAQVVDSLALLHQTVTSIPGLILIIVFLVGLILFCITAGIRGGELILMKALFPIFACDKVTTSRERWNGFFTMYIITWVSYGLQLFSFKMFAYGLQTLMTGEGIKTFSANICICLGWMVLMIRSPKWLQKFCYSSGVSGGVSRATRTATGAVPGVGRIMS